MTIRRLGLGDESIVVRLGVEAALGRGEAARLLADDRTIYVVCFVEEELVGFVFAHELLRRRGDPSQIFVYDLQVLETHRRRGIGRALMREVERIARARGVRTGFVLTNAANEPAMSLYGALGARRANKDDVMWDFDYGA